MPLERKTAVALNLSCDLCSSDHTERATFSIDHDMEDGEKTYYLDMSLRHPEREPIFLAIKDLESLKALQDLIQATLDAIRGSTMTTTPGVTA